MNIDKMLDTNLETLWCAFDFKQKIKSIVDRLPRIFSKYNFEKSFFKIDKIYLIKYPMKKLG